MFLDQQIQNQMKDHNRRNFLKTSAVFGSTFLFATSISNAATSTPQPRENMHKPENQRTLGKEAHALTVSTLGLGCMGMSYHRSFVPDRNAMISLLRKAPELGMNFYDTAEAYGPLINEELLGEAVAPFRKDIIIATKFGFVDGKPSSGLNSRPENIKKMVEHSLKSLRTDYIDLLYQHRVDPKVPIEDVAGTVKELIIEGKVKHFGMSEANEATIRKAHAIQPLTALQSEYSLMTRQPEDDVIKVCEELGIGFVPYSPLSRGLISGLINERTKYNAANDNRPSLPRYQKDAIIANWPLIETLKTFGDQRGLTVAQVALAWLLKKKPFIVPIPGTTKLAHLQENMWAANYEFTSSEFQQLTAAINQIKIVGERYTGLAAEQTKK